MVKHDLHHVSARHILKEIIRNQRVLPHQEMLQIRAGISVCTKSQYLGNRLPNRLHHSNYFNLPIDITLLSKLNCYTYLKLC